MKYRKKPVEIEAFRLTDDAEMVAPAWFTQAVADEKVWIDRSLVDGHIHVYGCTIDTPEGRMHARLEAVMNSAVTRFIAAVGKMAAPFFICTINQR